MELFFIIREKKGTLSSVVCPTLSNSVLKGNNLDTSEFVVFKKNQKNSVGMLRIIFF
jgi:hypothetical protein